MEGWCTGSERIVGQRYDLESRGERMEKAENRSDTVMIFVFIGRDEMTEHSIYERDESWQ